MFKIKYVKLDFKLVHLQKANLKRKYGLNIFF